MDAIDYWRFCDELTAVQAALLIVDEDPGTTAEYVESWEAQYKPKGYVAVLSALQHSIAGDRLPATKIFLNLDYQHPDAEHPVASLDWKSTRIQLTDLKAWLVKRGVQSGFFFPEGPVTADYLDAKNDCFAPKLAAAVEAWKAVRTERGAKPSPRSVKQDLTRWLNLNATKFGLTNEDGDLNKQAIDEVAKVANWNTKGGAPKTPGEPLRDIDDELDPPF